MFRGVFRCDNNHSVSFGQMGSMCLAGPREDNSQDAFASGGNGGHYKVFLKKYKKSGHISYQMILFAKFSNIKY